MQWMTEHDMDIFLEPVGMKYANGKPTATVDPNKKQWTNFNQEVLLGFSRGPSMEIWSSRDVLASTEMKVYYKYMKSNGATTPVTAFGYWLFDGRMEHLPVATLSQEHTATWVGTIKIGSDYSMKFVVSPEHKEAYEKRLAALAEADKKETDKK
jgi:hypothetical protein